MAITLDYTNMMAEAVGLEFGLCEEEIAGFVAQTQDIHQKIQKRRDRGELPFFDLPSNLEAVDEVLKLASELQDQFDNLIVLGIGGSALGTTAIFNALCFGHNL